jgi:hypothetical protein
MDWSADFGFCAAEIGTPTSAANVGWTIKFGIQAELKLGERLVTLFLATPTQKRAEPRSLLKHRLACCHSPYSIYARTVILCQDGALCADSPSKATRSCVYCTPGFEIGILLLGCQVEEDSTDMELRVQAG